MLGRVWKLIYFYFHILIFLFKMIIDKINTLDFQINARLHSILQDLKIGIFLSSAQSFFLQHFPQPSSSARAGGKIAAATSDVIFK